MPINNCPLNEIFSGSFKLQVIPKV